ncbi:ogr/Delta-like zinc finger family protein [Aeromonas veronii]|uniref:ogr/Delta-like zinc finger family protein n=1 Tax=Aeromonas veronii TaxID=654 RepID=UPI001302CE8A|nr:ogr/Delta-like zinc finger family protein [Aeromonas veronii]KAE9624632.1 transcriptional regulator [Aeromonas veronii]
MRVYCKVCGQRGRITKTNRLSNDVSDLYCQCTDAECGHSLMGSLTPEGRQLVLKGLGAQ